MHSLTFFENWFFQGAGSGVEIMVNEPYTDGPGGSGQFTRKIYHVGSHLPGDVLGLTYNQNCKHYKEREI